MGNTLGKFLKGARDDTPPASPPHQPGIASSPHFASPASVGLANLLTSETTSRVPEGLSKHVNLSKAAQAKWNDKMLAAQKESNPSPSTPEEAASLATDALEDESDAEFLEDQSSDAKSLEDESDAEFLEDQSSDSKSLEDESDAEFLEVDVKLVGGMKVHVDTDDPDEACSLLIELWEVMIQRHWAQGVRDSPPAVYRKYWVIDAPNGEEILAREYRTRLRYADILAAWNEPNPPRKPKEEESLVTDSLQDESDAESSDDGSDAESLEDESDAASLEDESDAASLEDDSDAESSEVFSVNCIGVSSTSSLPEGFQYELYTLPVDAKLVGDGDGMIVHVDTEDLDEDDPVLINVQGAAMMRRWARAARDYRWADELNKIITDAGYRVIYAPNGKEILAREDRIRLRGIDAPEMNMEYGREARDALRKFIQGKRLTIQVYEKDRYGRLVADVYCDGVLIQAKKKMPLGSQGVYLETYLKDDIVVKCKWQEKLLRKGCAWHYKAYDKRRSFAQWQREVRNAGRGLWANSNPVAPWVFKREERNNRNVHRQHQNRRNARRERVPNRPY